MTTKPGPAGGTRSRLDPAAVARRDFLGLAAKCSATAAGLFAILGLARLPKTAVLPSPSKRFRVTLPESLAPGEPSCRPVSTAPATAHASMPVAT